MSQGGVNCVLNSIICGSIVADVRVDPWFLDGGLTELFVGMHFSTQVLMKSVTTVMYSSR